MFSALEKSHQREDRILPPSLLIWRASRSQRVLSNRTDGHEANAAKYSGATAAKLALSFILHAHTYHNAHFSNRFLVLISE